LHRAYHKKSSKNQGKIIMSNTVLVTYASCTGSTIGVANEIGKTLSAGNLQVDVRPMKEVKDLTPYQAVVAGSAIQNKQWLPEAMEFMRIYKADLEKRQFAAYLICMTLAMKNSPQYRGFVSDFLQPVRAMVKPVSEGLFAGALDISKVPSASNRFKFRLSVKFGVWTEGDHRDWAVIRAWAESLRPLLSSN
jgi:menaquinone-dependent protoporphyrinogen oxidase